MRVYHASNVAVPRPDTMHSRDNLDFGRGFYVTPLREQAEKYAARLSLRRRAQVLNTYELDDRYDGLCYVRFERYDERWLDFVAACRRGLQTDKYDVIEGGVANDKVFDTVDLYLAGMMSKDDALRRLVFAHPNWQICLASQQAIDQCLTFISSETIAAQ